MSYKLNWNDEEKVFTVANCDETEGGGKSNIVGENDGMTPACVNNSQVANLMCWNANIKVAEGSVVVVKCRECGLYFLVTKTDVEWYENKGLDAPKRCMCCRRARSRKEHYLEMQAQKETETDNN